MIRFSNWLLQKESSASTRARAAAAAGLMPMAVVGSPNGHSTASPFETEQIKKAIRDSDAQNKKRHGKKQPKKSGQNTQQDAWFKEVEDLKDSLNTLKAVFNKKKELSKKAAAKDKQRGNKKLPPPTDDPEPHNPKNVTRQK